MYRSKMLGMLDTGLRNRFLVTIFVVLLVVATGSAYLYSEILKKEQLNLIDQQVRETATALIDSQLGGLRVIDFDEGDKIISEELGESRIGKFFIIRNALGDPVFESSSAKLLPVVDIPRDEQWFQIIKNGKLIRGLNLQLPRFPDRTLQVGLVLDERFISSRFFSSFSLFYIFLTLGLGLIVSMGLTSFLLRPISKLESFLNSIITSPKDSAILPEIPQDVVPVGPMESKDEFIRMVACLNLLIQKINRSYQISRLWAYQMAHELKHPLSLIGIGIEKIQFKHGLSNDDVAKVNQEIINSSEIISTFLNWAEIENSNAPKHLFVNSLGIVALNVKNRFREFNSIINLTCHEETLVLSLPEHLEQLIHNLLSNAVKYSEVGSVIEISISKEMLSITNESDLFPQEVLRRLGEPFNRGTGVSGIKGHGLGLAWCMSICRLYSWKLSITHTCNRVEVMVKFPRA